MMEDDLHPNYTGAKLIGDAALEAVAGGDSITWDMKLKPGSLWPFTVNLATGDIHLGWSPKPFRFPAQFTKPSEFIFEERHNKTHGSIAVYTMQEA